MKFADSCKQSVSWCIVCPVIFVLGSHTVVGQNALMTIFLKISDVTRIFFFIICIHTQYMYISEYLLFPKKSWLGPKKQGFWPWLINQHAQRKPLYFVNPSTEPSSKSVKIWLSKWIFYVKNQSKGTSINDVQRFLAIFDLPCPTL